MLKLPAGAGERQVAELELAVGGGERVGLQRVGAVGVALDQLGERVALELGAQVHAGRAGQVVEPVAVLQVLQLVLEHVVERGAQQATEQVGDLGETADPQVDVVETGVVSRTGSVGPGAGAEHEVGGVGRRNVARQRIDDRSCGSPLAGANVVAPVMRRVRAVGGDEVDQRLGVLEVLTEVGPVGVRRQLTVVGLREDLPADLVQRRDAHAAGTGHVDRRQVERQAEQVVAQRLGDELVELVADLIGRAHHDGARRLLGRQTCPRCRR